MHETQCKGSLGRSRGRQASREAGRYPGPVQGAADIQREERAEEKEMMSGDTEDNLAEGEKKARESNWQGKEKQKWLEKKYHWNQSGNISFAPFWLCFASRGGMRWGGKQQWSMGFSKFLWKVLLHFSTA